MAPMTRRRSARIASASKTCAPLAQSLDALAEQDETRAEQPQLDEAPRTPSSSSPPLPTDSEMHPSKTHVSLVPSSSALRLGFADIQSVPRSSKQVRYDTNDSSMAISPSLSAEATAALLQATPSRVSAASAVSATSAAADAGGVPSSSFTFRFTRRESAAMSPLNSAPLAKTTPKPDSGLSQEALRMMEELREKTTMIRADLVAEREQKRAAEQEAEGRRIAKPKSRSGRYSAAHSAQFEKMDSIANHPSAFRAALGRHTPVKAAVSTAAGSPATSATSAAAGAASGMKRGLKRTQSKANLDDTPKKAAPTPAAVHAATPSPAKRSILSMMSRHSDRKRLQPPSARKIVKTAPHQHQKQQQQQQKQQQQPVMSGAKRIKQNLEDDASTSRPVSRDGSFLPRLTAKPSTSSLASAASASAASTSAHASMPRSPAVASSLLTPTKSCLSRFPSVRAPGSVAKTPTHHGAGETPVLVSAMKKPATTTAATTATTAIPTVRLVEPSKETSSPAKRGIPQPPSLRKMAMPFSRTPGPVRVNKALPAMPVAPATTPPRRKLVKHVTFSPRTEQALFSDKSPSLFRSFIPRSGALAPPTNSLTTAKAVDVSGRMEVDASEPMEKPEPSVRRFQTILYPDLSEHPLLKRADSKRRKSETAAEEAKLTKKAKKTGETEKEEKEEAEEEHVPSTFTFRSDKTISFGQGSPTGFGSSRGQASLRHVRPSTAPVDPVSPSPASAKKTGAFSSVSSAMIPRIPGSFPGSFTASLFGFAASKAGSEETKEDKENVEPTVSSKVIQHGLTSKKRHRISEAEERADEEAAERAAKRRRNEQVAEGDALLAPRLVGQGSTGSIRSTPQKMMTGGMAGKTPMSSTKKRPVLSRSRLNSLAMPKLRK